MIPVGQIVRDRAYSTFKIGIVIGKSTRFGKVRVCRWQNAGKRWSPPIAMAEGQLEPILNTDALVVHHKFVVSDARQSVVNGLVRWAIGGPGGLTEIANVGRTIP